MKFAIDIGHNAPNKDTGARGIRLEDELTLSVGKRLIEILRENGHYVIETCPPKSSSLGGSLRHRVAIANSSAADIFVSIHFNAFNRRAYGSEVFALSSVGAAIGRSILDEIVKLGYCNRGVKRAPFYVLKHTSMPAVLVECCFCDSKKDMDLFDPDLMAIAIASGLIGEAPEVKNKLRTLKVKFRTWLKTSTQQSTALHPRDKILLDGGKYQLLAALPEEENHHWIRLNNGQEGFVYANHVLIN